MQSPSPAPHIPSVAAPELPMKRLALALLLTLVAGAAFAAAVASAPAAAACDKPGCENE